MAASESNPLPKRNLTSRHYKIQRLWKFLLELGLRKLIRVHEVTCLHKDKIGLGFGLGLENT